MYIYICILYILQGEVARLEGQMQGTGTEGDSLRVCLEKALQDKADVERRMASESAAARETLVQLRQQLAEVCVCVCVSESAAVREVLVQLRQQLAEVCVCVCVCVAV
jgi:hypothetical protein